jgi:membrane associated rhomboid family serine protease
MTRRVATPAGLRLILALIAVTALPELVLDGADLGLWGTPRWRPFAYHYGAFWAGLLRGQQPNYAAQPAVMFLTYAVLHAGFWHLASNMLALFAFGPPVARRAGPRGFVLIYLAAAVGGGIGFGLLSASPSPMVGASGALFGLAGAWPYHDRRRRRARGLPLAPLVQAIAGLALLNLALWWLLSGLLAWQTHLGGYIAGWTAAATLTVARRRLRAWRR